MSLKRSIQDIDTYRKKGKTLSVADWPETAIERFWKKVAKPDGNGCWLWTAAIQGRGAHKYGRFSHKRKMYGAHRVSYELYHGPVPPGMVVMHKCDVTTCVNPGHLALGTASDNIRDRDAKRRHWSHENAPRYSLHPRLPRGLG